MKYPTILVCAIFVHTLQAPAQTKPGYIFGLSSACNIPASKIEAFAVKKGFKAHHESTTSSSYQLKKIPADSLFRELVVNKSSNNEIFTYTTTSDAEKQQIINALQTDGYKTNRKQDFFQKNNIVISIGMEVPDSVVQYKFTAKQISVPNEVRYAEDLYAFTSHEVLAWYFGEKNVKKDLYYFDYDAVSKCSVLFPNSNKQVIFIWQDQENNDGLDKICIGNDLGNGRGTNEVISANLWTLKNGIRTGMSLYQLRGINEAPFSFGGGKSKFSGLILESENGKIDFRKNEIVLGCINCNDSNFGRFETINSDEAIDKSLIVFIHSIILVPTETKGLTQAQ